MRSGGGGWWRVLLAPLVLFILAAQVSCIASVEATGDEEDWVEVRLEAYFTLFNITSEGREVVEALDFRQMEGWPAWYGSTGYRGFTGVGQARPDAVAHELGHSYWGSFPVTGHPELSWDAAPGANLSTAMARYHDDLHRFMLQPPDRYEPLRERFRNFPNLTKGRIPDLIHAGEADIPRFTAGDLGLVPPILRKYFDRYLSDGGLETWADLMGWYAALEPSDRRLADTYLQIAHIPRDAYSGVEREDGAMLDDALRETLVGEERQRLIDFVKQFDTVLKNDDSLKDAVNVDRGFPFWRSYLREMFAFHKRYPEVVGEYEATDNDGSIESAFEALESAMALSHDRAVGYLTDRLEEDSFLYNFLPILDDKLLLAVLESEPEGTPPHELPKGADAFVEELRHFIADVEKIVEVGRREPAEGAIVAEQLVARYEIESPTKLQQSVDTFIDLLFSTDRRVAREIMANLPDDLAVALLELTPAKARLSLQPVQLVDALGIQEDADRKVFTEGLGTLFENSSGNFEIDVRTNEVAYDRIVARGSRDPEGTLEILRDVQPRVREFIAYKPEETVAILSSDLQTTLDLVLESGPVRTPPARLIYQIAYFDVDFAAEIVSGLGRRGEDEVVQESLAYFAYDLERSRDYPEQRISLEKDGEFLSGLMERNGSWWLIRMLAGAVEKYGREVSMGNVDRDFLEAFKETLGAAVTTIEGPWEKERLGRVVEEAFGVGRPHL